MPSQLADKHAAHMHQLALDDRMSDEFLEITCERPNLPQAISRSSAVCDTAPLRKPGIIPLPCPWVYILAYLSWSPCQMGLLSCIALRNNAEDMNICSCMHTALTCTVSLLLPSTLVCDRTCSVRPSVPSSVNKSSRCPGMGGPQSSTKATPRWSCTAGCAVCCPGLVSRLGMVTRWEKLNRSVTCHDQK